jgi:uncharacterized protein YfbU (UPF0304 family)
MDLSKKDRLLLINQYRILASLEKDDASHYNELIKILENGYSIFYSMVDEWISEDMPEEEGRFVLNVLDLYRAIEDVKRKSKSEELDDHHYSFFMGFDGNNETEYMAFSRFLVQEQGKFREQERYFRKNDNMNSHMPMIPKYRRMLDESGKYDIWNMDVQEALSILNA